MVKLAPLSITAAIAFFLAVAPVRAEDALPLAVPDDASEVVYSGDAGSLTFNSAKPVKELAEFYRAEGKKKGWQETPSVINKDNMAVLTFMAGEDEVSITVMTMGDKSMVTAEGAALEGKAAASADAGDSDASAPATPAAPPLTAIDKDGLPIPDGLGNMGSSSTQFSKSVNFSAPNSVADIVAFYRAELGKKGWKEDSAKQDDAEAELAFTTPEGPAKLTVKRNGDMTDAELTLNQTAKAAASPLAPKAGKVKILFGNMSDADAVVTIAGKKIKIPAGAGGNGPDGPSLEVKPGNLTASMGSAKESFKAGPDTIWMVGVGPGGLIVLQQ